MYERSIYSALDWLGDVGGLLDGMRILGSVLITLQSMVFGNPFNAFLLNALYMKESSSKSDQNDRQSVLNSIKKRKPYLEKFKMFSCIKNRKK